jgi:hypothetical protein
LHMRNQLEYWLILDLEKQTSPVVEV